MQMVLVEKLALTFAGDAHALASGFAKVAVRIVTAPFARMVRIVTAPIERIANACDVAGVYARRQAKRGKCRLDRLNPFKGLQHLT